MDYLKSMRKNEVDLSFFCLADDDKEHLQKLFTSEKYLLIFIRKISNINIRDTKYNTPLHYAARYSSEAMVRLMISAGALLNLENSCGETPFHFIVKKNINTLITFALEWGANIHKVDNAGIGSIHYVVQFADLEIIKKFIMLGANLDLPTNDRKTPLHYATITRDENIISYLLDQNPCVDTKDNDGMCPINYLMRRKMIPLVKRLLKKVTVLDSIDSKSGDTLLHYACEYDECDIAEQLLEMNVIDISTKNDENKKTIFLVACESSSLKLIKLIFSHTLAFDQAQERNKISIFNVLGELNEMSETSDLIDCPDNFSQRPIHFLVNRKFKQLAKRIIEMGTGVNNANREGYIPLHYACMNGDFEMIKYLHEKGSNLNARTKENYSCLYLTIIFMTNCPRDMVNRFDIVKYFIENGVNPNYLTKYDDSALSAACNTHNADLIEYLYKKTDHINKPNSSKEIPFFHLVRYHGRNLKLVKLFVEHNEKLPIHIETTYSLSTPMHRIFRYGSFETINYILETYEFDLGEYDGKKFNYIHYLMLNQDTKGVFKILNKYYEFMNFNKRTDHGWKPIHFAAKYSSSAVVRFLMDHTENLSNPTKNRDKYNKRPLIVHTVESLISKFKPKLYKIITGSRRLSAKFIDTID
jgi:ankyrin repeat protein